MRVYLSSTFQDLIEHRSAVSRAVARLGHQVVQMESYGAGPATPLSKVMSDVKSCEAFVGVYAWRLGSHPPAGDPDLLQLSLDPTAPPPSFIECELAAAESSKLLILQFMLADDAPWPPHMIEGFGDPIGVDRVTSFRDSLRSRRLIGQFETVEELEALVGTSLGSAQLSKQLEISLVPPMEMMRGDDFAMEDSGFYAVVEHLRDVMQRAALSAKQRTLKIDLSTGWWSTRLFLVAFFAETYTDIRQIVLVGGGEPQASADAEATGKEEFLGLVSTKTVVARLLVVHPQLKKFVAKLAGLSASDVASEASFGTLDQFWNGSFAPTKPEFEIRHEVGGQHLADWFGEAIMQRPLQIKDISRPTPVELALVLNYPHEFVPVLTDDEESPDKGAASAIRVVEQGELSKRIAKTYVSDLIDR